MRRSYFSHWLGVATVLAAVVSLPLMAIVGLALTAEGEIWPELITTMLPVYLSNTLSLMLGVAVVSTLIGVTTAWLVTRGPFPLSRFFTWGLLLPLALPAYLVAYIYTDLLEHAGPFQQLLRSVFGWESAVDYWFPQIRSLPGAILILSLTLYPYVYLLTRAAFLNQMVCVVEASRTLGCGPRSSFFLVTLPLARPAIFAGMMLVLMETINDFGTVDYFGVPTLTAGVFDIWLQLGDIGGAAQISLILLAMAILLVSLEQFSRRRQRFCLKGQQCGVRHKLALPVSWGASVCCALPIIFGFVIPTVMLVFYTLEQLDISAIVSDVDWWLLDGRLPNFLLFAGNSLMLAVGTALLAVAAALVMNYARRLAADPVPAENFIRLIANWTVKALSRTASLGYALPGAVIAVGVLVCLAQFDQFTIWLREHWGLNPGILLSGSLFALFMAYLVRYLAIASGALASNFEAISPSLDAAAATLGASRWRILTQIHLPLLRSGLLSGMLLVFVDSMKELPATLLLRPFQFETLATYIYQYASDERLAECAPGALMIVVACLPAVLILARALSWSPSWNSPTANLAHDHLSTESPPGADPPLRMLGLQSARSLTG